jgi:hypothetical protein
VSSSGGRIWWAHIDFTRINIDLTIGEKEIEESLWNEPKTSRVGKCRGYLELASVRAAAGLLHAYRASPADLAGQVAPGAEHKN